MPRAPRVAANTTKDCSVTKPEFARYMVVVVNTGAPSSDLYNTNDRLLATKFRNVRSKKSPKEPHRVHREKATTSTTRISKTATSIMWYNESQLIPKKTFDWMASAQFVTIFVAV